MGKLWESSKCVQWRLRSFQFEVGRVLEGLKKSSGSHRRFIFYVTLYGVHGKLIELWGAGMSKSELPKGSLMPLFLSTVKRFNHPFPFPPLNPCFLLRGGGGAGTEIRGTIIYLKNKQWTQDNLSDSRNWIQPSSDFSLPPNVYGFLRRTNQF